MNNNILRTAKVKDRRAITSAAEHNFRFRSQANIDATKSNLNQVLVNSLEVDLTKADDLQKKLSAHYQGLGIKERADNVLMLEFVISASPEFFKKRSKSEIDDWASHQVQFMKTEFGEQIKIAVLHLDEKTPHLHFMIGTEFKSVKKYKNQKGEFHKETWSLNAKRYDPEFLIGLHDRHSEHNKKFGLKRGVKGSMRKHTSLKKFYEIVDKALSTDYDKAIEKSIESLETGFLTGKVSIEDLRKKFKPALNTMFKQNKALKEKFAIDFKDWAEKLAAREIELTAKEDQLNLKQQTQNLKYTAIDKLKKENSELTKINQELLLRNDELIKQLPRPKGSANQHVFLKKA